MNNKQCAHLWANKSRTSAKGSHFYFEGDTIYSYGSHFPIARHYKGVILFTSKSYSVSTSKHIGIARSACSHLKSFTVADVMSNPSAATLKSYRESIESLSMSAARARDPKWKLQMLESEVNEANDFAETFKFKTRFEMPSNLDELKAKAKEQAAKKAKQTAAKNAKFEADCAELVAQWIAGERVSLPYQYAKVHLRSNKCSRQGVKSDLACDAVMETTKGATIPLAEAQKAFRFVMLKRTTGWHRNGDTFAIGEFHLDAVNEQGVVAGCHRIAWDEIERFAKTQGWLSVA